MLNTQKRYGHTAKKMITLTHEGRQQIQQFADAHDMNFSATIETLALIGMKADLTDLLIPLLREIVSKAIQRNFNRIAKLSLLGAAEAAMAHDLITMILLQLVRQQAEHSLEISSTGWWSAATPTMNWPARFVLSTRKCGSRPASDSSAS